MGEAFALVDASGPWGWGYGCHDDYVGYLPLDALGGHVAASHVVATLAGLLFAAPDIKSPVQARLPMGARVAGQAEGEFVRAAGGFVHRRHLRAAGAWASDPIEIAERLIGVPYLWGGRSGDGIDCSGLVQLALAACGVAAPRDSDLQRAIGRELAPDEPLARGDLVFLPGHVALMADEHVSVHANAYWMAVTREPLAAIVERQPAGGGVLMRRRPEW